MKSKTICSKGCENPNADEHPDTRYIGEANISGIIYYKYKCCWCGKELIQYQKKAQQLTEEDIQFARQLLSRAHPKLVAGKLDIDEINAKITDACEAYNLLGIWAADHLDTLLSERENLAHRKGDCTLCGGSGIIDNAAGQYACANCGGTGRSQ